MIAFSTIVSNYLYVFSTLVAFIFIASGALGLLMNIHLKKISFTKYFFPMLLIIIISVIDIIFTFTNDNRQVATIAINASYYLPDILILTTITIPSILTLVMGAISIVRLVEYRREVKGLLYKKALHNFILGVLFVIISSAIIQIILSLGAARLLGLGLEAVLGIVYLFVAIQAIGNIFIAKGAKNLTTIEKV